MQGHLIVVKILHAAKHAWTHFSSRAKKVDGDPVGESEHAPGDQLVGLQPNCAVDTIVHCVAATVLGQKKIPGIPIYSHVRPTQLDCIDE